MIQEVEAPPSPMRNLRAVTLMVRWHLGYLWLSLIGRMSPAIHGRRMRRLFEQLGGMWIHIGRLLALRVDVLSTELAGQLHDIHAPSRGFSFEQVRRIVEEELGAPLESVFESFQERPFSVEPAGQIHSARLRIEGVQVAVKIQRPYFMDVCRQDLSLIRSLVRLASWIGLWPHLRLEEMAWELEQVVREDSDYRFEAAQARNLKKSLKKQGIFIPRVFTRYCSRRVMVQEFFRAALMGDYLRKRRADPLKANEWLLENEIDRKVLGRRLLDSLMRQIFEDNLYHGDLSPEHIVLFRDSRVGFVDFGACTFTEVEYLNRFRLFVRSLATRDYAKAADLCFLLCAYLPPIDMEAVKEEVVQCLRAWAVRTNVPELPYAEKSLHNATVEVVGVLWRHRCAMSWTFMRIREALTTLDESLSELLPEINYTRYLKRYFRQAEGRSLRAFVRKNPMAQILSATASAFQIQDRVNEYTMFQGSLIRRHAQVFQARTNKVAYVLSILAGQVGILIVALFILTMGAFLGQHKPEYLISSLSADARALANRLPHFDQWTWVLALLFELYILKGFWDLRSRLSQAEIRSTGD